MDFQSNTTQIILAVIALFAVGIIIRISFKKKSKEVSNNKSLKNVKAGGDIVFGDKKTKTK
jgi:predicted small secreted protein